MIGRVRRRLALDYRRMYLEVAEWRAKLAPNDSELRSGGIKPENIVWIFGSGRSGSTWLRSMMSEIKGHRVWEEPLVGRLFGEFYGGVMKSNLQRPDFIMGDATRKGWTKSIRNFVLDGARYARPRIGPEDYLVVKEPNGSVGAPLLVEALPESRMILLIRDPRDVVASVLDGARRGGWLYEWEGKGSERKAALADTEPDAFVERRARTYLRDVEGGKRAYDLHQGSKVLVEYEDLRRDTLGTMKRIYSELEIRVDEGALARAVEKHSWANLPEKNKGKGKFYRKATPGGWREDLTPRQVRTVERITAPLLEEFYPV